MTNTESRIQIPIRLSEADVYKALVALRFGALRWVVILVSCVVTALVLLFVLVFATGKPMRNPQDMFLNAVPLLGVVAAVGVTIFAVPYFQARSFIRSPKSREESIYTFTSSGCQIEGPNGSSDLKWAAFLSAKETRDLFLLYPQKNLAYIIPKRSFASGSEVQAFRELVRQEIQNAKLSS